jgi:N-acetyl-gamma-glutamyl-phosphate reductase
VVFLALEHGESGKMAGEILDAGPGMVVDLAADFRITDPRLHERYYGAHPAPQLVHRFRYGLADVLGESLRGATAIAAPGCFASAAQLALYPLRTLALAGPPALFGVTGSSGAGVHARPSTHHPARAHNLFAYSPMGHRHEGEVLEQWRAWTGNPQASARLMTHSGPFVRGIYLTLHATLAPESPALDAAGASRLLADSYAGRPFVRITSGPPELTHAVGTNNALIHAVPSADGREVQVMVADRGTVVVFCVANVVRAGTCLCPAHFLGYGQCAVYPAAGQAPLWLHRHRRGNCVSAYVVCHAATGQAAWDC